MSQVILSVLQSNSQSGLQSDLRRAESVFDLKKKITTVGSDRAHDIYLGNSGGSEASGVLAFSLVCEEDRVFLVPGRAKVQLNGASVSHRIELQSCDQVRWNHFVLVYLESQVGLETGAVGQSSKDHGSVSPVQAWEILQNLAATLQTPGQSEQPIYLVERAIQQSMDALVQIAGAEEGYLLSEANEKSEWKLLASSQSHLEERSPKRKELFSDTIIQKAIETRNIVYVESMIGHHYASAESVISARMFSVACIPLLIADRVFGVVFLLTRSPGRSIKKESLPELRVLATQAALMLASHEQLKWVRSENRVLQDMATHLASGPVTRLIFDRSNMASPMLKLENQILKVGKSPLDVLVLGETGTGKEMVARELHRFGARSKGPFVAVNCAAIPATLMESTLFGFEKGAFTGAHRDHEGKFVQANGGTLFLDEVGDLPIELQVKLLRILQERVVDPVGSSKSIPINVRVITATHRNLEKMVKEGTFRQDLYFRISGMTLEIPPLRARKNDIPLLSLFFLEKVGIPKVLDDDALRSLEEYRWPGNVRELEHVMSRAAHLSEGQVIRSEDLGLPVGVEFSSFEGEAPESSEFDSLDEAQSAFTFQYVQRWLKKMGGNRADTAKKLGISERTLYRILAQE